MAATLGQGRCGGDRGPGWQAELRLTAPDPDPSCLDSSARGDTIGAMRTMLIVLPMVLLMGCDPGPCENAAVAQGSLFECAQRCSDGDEDACQAVRASAEEWCTVRRNQQGCLTACLGNQDHAPCVAYRESGLRMAAVSRARAAADQARAAASQARAAADQAHAADPPPRGDQVPAAEQAAPGSPEAAAAAVHRDLRAQAQLPTAQDALAVPRSAAPGEPGLAHSCNLIRTNRECYEMAPSAGSGVYYGSAAACGPAGIFGVDACPTEGRLGSCVLRDGQQVAHFYEDHASPQTECEGSYSGHWVTGARVFPINASAR